MWKNLVYLTAGLKIQIAGSSLFEVGRAVFYSTTLTVIYKISEMHKQILVQ